MKLIILLCLGLFSMLVAYTMDEASIRKQEAVKSLCATLCIADQLKCYKVLADVARP
jgi:hypothetical protein